MLATEAAALEDKTKKLLASLILIGMSKNQQHVSAVAANYRKLRSTAQPTAPIPPDTSTPAAAAGSTSDPSLSSLISFARSNPHLAHRLN